MTERKANVCFYYPVLSLYMYLICKLFSNFNVCWFTLAKVHTIFWHSSLNISLVDRYSQYIYTEQLVNNIIYIREHVNNIFFVLKSHHSGFMRQCTNYTACYATKRADAILCSVAFNARPVALFPASGNELESCAVTSSGAIRIAQ